MELKDLMALVNAGFTKAEIMQLTGSKTEKAPETKPEAKPEPKKEEPKKEEKAAEPDVIADAINKAFDERFKSVTENFEGLYNKMATMAGMPSLAEVKPKGVEDIISNFFKEE